MAKRHFGVTVSMLGCVFSFDIPPDAWRTHLRGAARDRSSSQWRLGDLLRYGEDRYGETYDQTLAELGLGEKTAANLKSVAGRVPISRRREDLSFGHHADVAALGPADQDRLLKMASKAKWTRATLREEVAKIRTPEADPTPARQVETTPFLIPKLKPQGVSTPLFAPTKSAVVSESKPLTFRASEPYGEELELLLGSGGEATRLRGALSDLCEWETNHGSILDARSSGFVRQLHRSIERQLTGASGEVESEDPEPRRRLN